MRRFCSVSWSSRLRNESSWLASSGSTAPPCVRRRRPSWARIARSRRAVIDEIPNARSTVAHGHAAALREHREDESPALLGDDRRRGSGLTFVEHQRRSLSEPGACTGSYVCAKSRSHMFDSRACGSEMTESDHTNDHSNPSGNWRHGRPGEDGSSRDPLDADRARKGGSPPVTQVVEPAQPGLRTGRVVRLTQSRSFPEGKVPHAGVQGASRTTAPP